MQAIVHTIGTNGLGYAILTDLPPTSTALRLKYETHERDGSVKKTIIAVHFKADVVHVRPDIDPSTDTVFPFTPLSIEGLSPENAAKLVVGELLQVHGIHGYGMSLGKSAPRPRN